MCVYIYQCKRKGKGEGRRQKEKEEKSRKRKGKEGKGDRGTVYLSISSRRPFSYFPPLGKAFHLVLGASFFFFLFSFCLFFIYFLVEKGKKREKRFISSILDGIFFYMDSILLRR